MALNASENGSRLASKFLNEHPMVRREDYLAEGERLARDCYKDGMKRFSFVEAWQRAAKCHVFSSDRARAARIQALLDVINEEGYPARSERAKLAEQELMALGAEGKCGMDSGRLYVAGDV